MKKQPKPKPRNRKHRRPNPARGMTRPELDKIMANVEDAELGGMLGRVLGSLLFPMLCPGFGRKVFDSLKPGSTIVEVECACGGTCACHTGLQIAGVPCPPDCPNYADHLDGCHRCDCPAPSKPTITGDDQKA